MPLAIKPTGILSEPISRIEKFASNFTMGQGCWLWHGGRSRAGYGVFPIGYSSRMAHRIMWELVGNPVDLSKQMDHICEVTSCVNPKHLRQVTARENGALSTNGSAINRAKTHCAKGHEFTPENTYIGKAKYQRVCRTCQRAWGLIARSQARKELFGEEQ